MDHDEHLERWTEAGLIDRATADSIRRFEEAQRLAAKRQRPALVEALLYLGMLVVAAGIVALVGQNWEELQSPARVSALAVPAGLALLLGFALLTTDDEAFRRGGAFAWLAATALAWGALLVVFHEYQDSNDERIGLLVGSLSTLGLAFILWAISNSAAQLLGIAGAMVAFGEALGDWPDDYSAAIAGVAILLLGAAAIAMVELRVFRPAIVSAPLFGLLAAAGAFHAGIDGKLLWAELMAFVIAGGLLGLSLWRGRFGYLLTGIGLAFLNLVVFIFEHFENDIGAPVALILSGAVLVAAVLMLIPLRRMVEAQRA